VEYTHLDPDAIAVESWARGAKATELLQAVAGSTAVDAGTIANLRRSWSADVITAAIDITRARSSAQDRLDDADTLIADHAGAQQATPAVLAAWKAMHIAASCPDRTVFDAGCGIGSDSRAFARLMTVRAIDTSAARCWMTEQYAAITATQATLSDLDQVRGDVLHMDPARRDENGKRLHNPATWSPNIDLAREAWDTHLDACLMLGPGIDLDLFELPEHVQLAFCSRNGSLVDAAAWSGAVATFDGPRTAVQLHTGSLRSGAPNRPQGGPAPKVGQFLHTPDPAIERAALLYLEATTHSLWEPAPGLGLLVGDTPAPSTWLQPWRIDAVLPPRRKAIARWLNANDGGSVTIRTRGGAVSDVDRLARALSGPGGTPMTVFILRLRRKISAFVVQNVLP